MDLSHLTQKFQEALRDAQTWAVRFGHQEVDGEHLLLALPRPPLPGGSWGPGEAEVLLRGHPRWQQPWLPEEG